MQYISGTKKTHKSKQIWAKRPKNKETIKRNTETKVRKQRSEKRKQRNKQRKQKNEKAKLHSGAHVKGLSNKVKLSFERLSKLLEQQAEANINLIVPGQSSSEQHKQKSGHYTAQLGAFAQLENAKAEKNRLETKFSTLFVKLPIHIAEITGSGPRFYRIQTSGLSRKHVKTLCNMMWPHKITCLIKRL